MAILKFAGHVGTPRRLSPEDVEMHLARLGAAVPLYDKAHSVDTTDSVPAIHSHITAIGAEMENLKAELARLTPTGQVAEDERCVQRWLAGIARGDAGPHAALSRLAAKAQQAEEMEARSRTIFTELTHANATITTLTHERDAAVADNAALFGLGERLYALAQHDEACKMIVGSEFAMCDCAMGEWQQVQRDMANGSHPGATLLKEKQEQAEALKRAKNEGLKEASRIAQKIAGCAQNHEREKAALDIAILCAEAQEPEQK